MGASTSHNRMGLQGLLQGQLYFTLLQELMRRHKTQLRRTYRTVVMHVTVLKVAKYGTKLNSANYYLT
jgi:hypothetical protein